MCNFPVSWNHKKGPSQEGQASHTSLTMALGPRGDDELCQSQEDRRAGPDEQALSLAKTLVELTVPPVPKDCPWPFLTVLSLQVAVVRIGVQS